MSPLLKLPLLAVAVAFITAPPARGEPPAVVGKPVRTDQYGGVLPEGALARLGSIRLRHDGEARHVTFLPDGKMLASYGEDKFVRFWDAATGRELHRIAVLTSDYTSSCALSPDGRIFAAGREDNFLHF